MSCPYVQYRIPEQALEKSRLFGKYQKRLHNKGVIVQRPEFDMIAAEYPHLASQIDEIPCGKCIQCRLQRSREWANRCMLELKTCENAYFLTLTYSDEHLKFAPYVDPGTGETSTRPVLVPKDLQKFLKRLRFWCSSRSSFPVRFYACGEYGESTQRPHYHLIVFNLPQVFEAGNHLFDYSAADTPLWTCDALTKLWPYGLAVYGQVTWNTCAYVARYCMKKRLGKSRQDQKAAQEQLFPGQPWQEEFTRMSLRPAIGKDYYLQNREQIYLTDECRVNLKGTITPVKPAKYYDRLYDVDNPIHLKRIKAQRKIIAKQQHDVRMTMTSLSSEQYALKKEASKIAQAQKLIRPSI